MLENDLVHIHFTGGFQMSYGVLNLPGDLSCGVLEIRNLSAVIRVYVLDPENFSDEMNLRVSDAFEEVFDLLDKVNAKPENYDDPDSQTPSNEVD
jgi:hypothetical protein